MLLSSKLISSTIIKICLTSMLHATSNENTVTCPEILALAELESSFDINAVGKVGERGLYQVRPEFWGMPPKSVEGQTRHALTILSRLKSECNVKTVNNYLYLACWNVGTAKGKTLRRNKTGPYRQRYIKLLNKWKKWYDQEETRYILFTNLRSLHSTKNLVKAETLVSTVCK